MGILVLVTFMQRILARNAPRVMPAHPPRSPGLALDRRDQAVEQGALARQDLFPRRGKSEPFGPVDLREAGFSSAPRRPFEFEKIAFEAADVEVPFAGEGGDPLAAGLDDVAQRAQIAAGGRRRFLPRTRATPRPRGSLPVRSIPWESSRHACPCWPRTGRRDGRGEFSGPPPSGGTRECRRCGLPFQSLVIPESIIRNDPDRSPRRFGAVAPRPG